jgi:hypothetical protein
MSGLKETAAMIAAFVRKHWKTISGFGIYNVFSWVYDNPIWMAAELKWKFNGVVFMMIGAFVINTIVLIYFSNKDTKWIGWNALDELSAEQEEHEKKHSELRKSKNVLKIGAYIVSYVPFKLAMILLWCLRKSPKTGDIAAFCILPIIQDPFIATAYLRHGYNNGLRKKDIAIYLSTSVISIGYWAIRNGMIVETFRHLVK